MSCSSPATQDSFSYVDLCASYMTDWADQALRVVEALHRLIVFSAESPHITTLVKVLWAGRVEILANLASEGLVE